MQASSPRWRALDLLRGLTLFVMVPINAMMDFAKDPPWFNHSPGPHLNLADFVLPIFLFAMGVSASFSLERRRTERGFARTLAHGLIRYAALFAAGSIGFFLVWKQKNWEVLQLLGTAGGFAFLFMFLPSRWRLAAVAAILLATETLRPIFLQARFREWYASGLGGPWGFLPYSTLSLAASVLGEKLREADLGRRVRLSLAVGLVAIASGLAWDAAFGPPDKHLVTPGFLALSFGAASVLLGLLSALETHVEARPVAALGRNPLFVYVFSGILILPIRAWADPTASEALVWAWGAAVLAASAAVAWLLDRQQLYLKL